MKSRWTGATHLNWLSVTTIGLCTALLAPPCIAAELNWSAPSGCDADVFVANLEATTEENLESLPVGLIQIVVVRNGAASPNWQLAVSLSDNSEPRTPTRTIRGSSCEDVSRAAAVAVAMAVHEARPEPAVDAAPRVEEERPVAAEVSKGTATATVNATSPATPAAANGAPHLQFPVQLVAGVDGALQGVPSIGVGLGVGVGLDQLHVRVRGVYFFPSTQGDERGIELQSTLGTLDACWDMTSSNVRPRLCLGYEAGAITGLGRGSALTEHRQKTAAWHALKPEVGLVTALVNDLFFEFSVAGAVALTEATFVYNSGRVAHELPRFSLRGNAAFGWAF